MIRIAISLALLCLLPCVGDTRSAVPDQAGLAADAGSAQAQLVREVAADTGKSPAALRALLDQAQYKQSIIDAMERPAEAKPWSQYRAIFLTPARIDSGIDFYREHRALLERISAQYGVPAPIIVAIIGVETSYGGNTGRYRVLDALATLAFHYPPRADYFRGELKALLELPDNKLAGPIDTLRGSYAGAQGWGQFMPSSIRDFAVDANGDGRIDLNNSLPDILASVAHYFAQHGWQPGAPIVQRAWPVADPGPAPAWDGQPPGTPLEQFTAAGYLGAHADPGASASLLTLDAQAGPQYWLTFQNFYVITRYNHSPRYAMAVTQLAQAIAQGAGVPMDSSGGPARAR